MKLGGKKGAGRARKEPRGLRMHRASPGTDFVTCVTCQDSETTASHGRLPANCDHLLVSGRHGECETPATARIRKLSSSNHLVLAPPSLA